MPKIFFCSDLHLGHLAILKYEPIRLKAVWQKYFANQIKFKNFKKDFDERYEDKLANALYFQELLSLHDKLLVANWNSVVSDQDTVWFLGDFCMGKRSAVASYVKQLNGTIKMIKGNHDNYPNKVYLDAGIRFISEFPIILKQKFILSHAPLDQFIQTVNQNLFINLFGHVHSDDQFRTKTSYSQCVCLERQALVPIQIPEFEHYYN